MSSRYEWHVLWFDYKRRGKDKQMIEVFANPEAAADRIHELWELEREAELIPVYPLSKT